MGDIISMAGAPGFLALFELVPGLGCRLFQGLPFLLERDDAAHQGEGVVGVIAHLATAARVLSDLGHRDMAALVPAG